MNPLDAPPAADVLLRAARHEADLSQRELARRAGVNRSVVARIEAGLVAPGFSMVVRLLAAAGSGLVAVDPSGRVLRARDFDDARDAGDRHWPAHLEVRLVQSDSDWWFSRMLPGERPLPQFTADWRRLYGQRRVRRLKGESLEQARARAGEAQAGNTPPQPEVTDEDTAAG